MFHQEALYFCGCWRRRGWDVDVCRAHGDCYCGLSTGRFSTTDERGVCPTTGGERPGFGVNARFAFDLPCFPLLCTALHCFDLLWPALLCFAVLCFALLCFAVLCRALRCFAVLCRALRCSAVLCRDFAMILRCIALRWIALPCLALPCLALPCLALLCFISFFFRCSERHHVKAPSCHVYTRCAVSCAGT